MSPKVYVQKSLECEKIYECPKDLWVEKTKDLGYDQ